MDLALDRKKRLKQNRKFWLNVGSKVTALSPELIKAGTLAVIKTNHLRSIIN